MVKQYRIKRNGESLQAFEDGQYLGSMSVKDLCLEIKAARTLHRALAQPEVRHK